MKSNRELLYSPMLNWPPGLAEIVQSYLSNDNGDKVIRSMRKLPKKELLFFFGKENLLLASIAAYYAIKGRLKEFKSLVIYAPELLLYKIEITGPNGVIIKGTPYQVLLWTDDNYFKYKNGETFVGMAKRLLKEYHGEEEEKAQRERQLLGWEQKEIYEVVTNRREFDKVINALDESLARGQHDLEKGNPLVDAIKKFKEHFKSEEIITHGKNCILPLWNYASIYYSVKKSSPRNSERNHLFFSILTDLVKSLLPEWEKKEINGDNEIRVQRNKPLKYLIIENTCPPNCNLIGCALDREMRRYDDLIIKKGKIKTLSQSNPPETMPSSYNFFSRNLGKIGFSSGFVVGAGIGVLFLMMRLLDFATFGASLAITLPVTICLFGIITGSITGGAAYLLNKNRSR